MDVSSSSSSSHVEGAKERDQRIQSARKKLKSYRAKQAQMEKKRVSLIAPSAASSSSSRLSMGSNDGISASAVQAQADAMAAQVAREVEATSSSHARTSSRAGHGRGHSRTGSISIAALTASAAPSAPTSRPQSIVTTAFVASTPKSHVRGHSRSASRSAQRPASMLLSATNSKFELTGGSDWKDVIDSTARPVSVGAPLSSTAENTPRLNATAVQTEESSAASASAMPSHARKASRHSRRTSVSTRRESMEIMGGLSLGLSDMASGSSNANNNRSSRRFSSNRHSGIMSASVLFGGPAEVLPVGAASGSQRRSSVRQDFDWRVFAPGANNEDSSIDDTNDRLTALEKLEGRSRSISPAPVESTPPRTPEGASPSNRRHSRQTSVQLPSFDDVHGAEAMDRRASLTLLESNQATTSSERPLSQGAPRSSLALPTGFSPGAEEAINATSASSSASGRPSSIRLTPDATPLLEGLGTLVEEEEEEEDSTTQSPPQGKRTSLESDGAEERRKRKQDEQETIKRNRRGSLTPRPLKLKSRPASLYVGTQLTYGGAALAPSPSLPPLAGTPDTAGSDSQFADYEDASTVDSSDAASTPRSAVMSLQQQPQQVKAGGSAQSSPLARDWSLSGAQQKLASARANVLQQQQHTSAVSATPDMKRSWRSSLPASSLVSAPAPASAPAATPVASTTAAPRQGMRALRLGSGSISSPAQHNGPSESVSSAASFATSASSSTNATPPSSSAAAKRLSMSIMTAREEAAAAPSSTVVPASATSTMAKRRSSIGYRSSSASGSAPISGESTVSPLAVVPTAPPAAVAAPISVTHAVYEELKSAHTRANSLLEGSRKQVERLTRELAVESERSAREYAELERWSAEEKRTLGTRIEHLERSASSSAALAQRRAAEAEASVEKLEAKLREAEENLEDLTAERDMLQDDVDGWRTRCGDLEKTLRTERSTLDEERRLRTAAKARAKMLFEKLEAAGIEAPPTPVEERTFEDGLPTDLVTALRSPALGSASPVIGANGGYFSPATPAGDGAPHPHAVKLLKDMRQQIFNLAGSLEHERSEHVKAKQEADALREELANLRANASFATVSSGAGHDSPPTSPPRNASISSAPGARTSKPKRHVFAYDSSMGSNSMSMGSVSIATTAPSSAVPSEQGHGGSRDEKDDFASASQSFATTSTSEEDLAGLGMGGLQTLAETEEEEGEALSEAATPLAKTHDMYDVEAAMPAAHDEEDGRRESESDSVAPSTPGLVHSGSNGAQTYFADQPVRAAPPTIPVLTIEGVAIPPSTPSSSADHSARSSESSMESHGPASPPSSHVDVASDSAAAFGAVVDAADASATVVVDDYLDELEELDEAAANPTRPEFIREWSFELATAAIKAKQQKVMEARRARQAEAAAANAAAAVAARRPRRRQPSIEDFFGLMMVDAGPLPALPVPDEALEMPPVYVDQSSQYSPPTSIDYRSTSTTQRYSGQSSESYSYDHSPRVSMRISTGSSSASSLNGARRNSAALQQRSAPPVARSAMAHNAYGAAEEGALMSNSGAMSALPSAVLSRMSLTGLTSAFSGLGGYLSGQSAAIQVAAAATKACAMPASHLEEGHGGSISWSAQRSVENDEEDVFAAQQQAARRW